MTDLLLSHSLEDGFNAINPKLVEFLREPEKVIPEIVQTNDPRAVAQYMPPSTGTPPGGKATAFNSGKRTAVKT